MSTSALLTRSANVTQDNDANTVLRPLHHGQAIRLIPTKEMPHQEWLQQRKQGLGASDASIAVGLNPFQSPLSLWMNKTGRSKDHEVPLTEDSPLTWGTILEPIVAEHYAKRTGRKVRRVNAILQHPDYPWMLANLDRAVVGDDEVQILECKTAGVHSAKLWNDGVPEYIQLQVQHELAVTGYQAADVAVLIGGQKLEIYRINRDEVLITQLIALEQQFWHYVEKDVPPPADGSISSDEALRLLYPNDNQQTLDLREDVAANDCFTELLGVRDKLTALQDSENQLKQRLQEIMQAHSIALFQDGKITWKQSKPVMRFNSKSFKSEHAELYQRYSQETAGSRRFLIQSQEVLQ